MNIISLTVKNATKVVQNRDIPFIIWGGTVPSRPPAVLVTPFWKPPKNFPAYAPESLVITTHQGYVCRLHKERTVSSIEKHSFSLSTLLL